MRWFRASCVAPALLCFSSAASAQVAEQEGFRLERMALAPTPEDGFALTLPDTLGHLRWVGTVSLGYALQPFQFRGPPAATLVSQRLSADLLFALGLYEHFEAYARVPFVLVSAGDDTSYERTTLAAPGGFAAGDAALGGTARVFRVRDLTIGARAELVLPTGSQSELTSDYAIAPRGHALASYGIWRLTFGLEGGAVYRPIRAYGPVRISSEYEWVAGARFRALDSLDFWLEGFGTRSARRPKEAAALDTVDVLLSGRYRAPVGPFCLHTSAGVGTGFSDAAGDADLRVMFNIALSSEKDAETSASKAHDAANQAAQPTWHED